MTSKVGLTQDKVDRCRKLALEIVTPVQDYIHRHTTTTVERATLRLLGADGADENGTPVPNLIIDKLGDAISQGAATWYLNALIKEHCSPEELNRKIVEGLDISGIPLGDQGKIEARGKEQIVRFTGRIYTHRETRRGRIEENREREHSPLLYVIVATGNIYEDVKQARAAAIQGADVIAVIRTTAQSLLDYVPYGATTEGFGGTYATQENFKIMRSALDEVGEEIGKYIRLVNYASGLCMPEIAVMGALERLDMMLNDSMYGILFRDINMYRTFVDQNFSRMLNAYAGITINTGEDNYLTTSDAYEKGFTVLASQFINEQFALNAGMDQELMGLGHAFEMDPELENGFLYELSQAQLVREIFPKSPLKYMPPTKHMTGDIFKGYAMNTLFNFIGRSTGQGILLLGMLTEAIHTPFLQDRHLAIQNARYVLNNIKDLGDEITFRQDGIIVNRAKQVMDKTLTFLGQIHEKGLLPSIEEGLFAEVKRRPDGGKGLDGVLEKSPDYWNPVEDFLKNSLEVE